MILDRGDAQDGRDGRGHPLDLRQGGLHRRAQFFNPGFIVKRALNPGAGDGERSAQIVGDVVAYTLEPVQQARDFAEHEVDRASYFVDVVVFVGDWQTRIEFAIHDPDNGMVNALQALRCSQREKRADRQTQQNRRKEGDCQCMQQSSCRS